MSPAYSLLPISEVRSEAFWSIMRERVSLSVPAAGIIASMRNVSQAAEISYNVGILPCNWSFSFSIIPSKEIPGLISFRMDWLDLLAVQGTQSCPTLCYLMDCSPPVSSVPGILQARILEWVAISFSRGSSWSRDQTQVSCVTCIGRWILYHCTKNKPLLWF